MTLLRMLNVLYADGQPIRANGFRIKSTNYCMPFRSRIVRSREEMDNELEGGKWDLLILSDWVPYHRSHELSTFDAVVSAYHRGNIVTGVICVHQDQGTGEKWVMTLMEEGVPAKYVPYNPVSPDTHLLVDVPGAKLEVAIVAST